MNQVTKASDLHLPLPSEAEHQCSVLTTHSLATPSSVVRPAILVVALLTGGGDKPYALGMAAALTSVGIRVDFIGSDDLNVPEVLSNPRVNFLNLRGDQRSEASPIAKMRRSIKVLRETYWLCGHSKTKALPYFVEQQIRALRPHAVDALLQVARQKNSLDRPQRECG